MQDFLNSANHNAEFFKFSQSICNIFLTQPIKMQYFLNSDNKDAKFPLQQFTKITITTKIL